MKTLSCCTIENKTQPDDKILLIYKEKGGWSKLILFLEIKIKTKRKNAK